MDLKKALLAVAAAGVVGSCGGAAAVDPSTEGRLEVAAAFYPYQFVAERVGGSDVTVTNLTKPGGERADHRRAPGRGSRREGPPRVAGPGPARAHRRRPRGTAGERSPERAEGFRHRAAQLQTELGTLDDQLRTGLGSCQRKELVTSHDAYGYLAGAYGLRQVQIAGLSPEDEASAGRPAEIATQARTQGVTTILFEELVSPKVAESLAREVGARATVLSLLEGAPESGDDVTAMQQNLTTLRTAGRRGSRSGSSTCCWP